MASSPSSSSPAPLALILRNGSVLALLMAAAAFLRLPEGLFLALGALTVLESDLGQGVLAGRERLLGTLCGLVAVVIAAGALGGAPLPLAIFGGLTLVRLFSFAAGLRSGYIVGGQVVAGSLLHHGLEWWPYALFRTVTTLLGVGIGILVSRHINSQRSLLLWQADCRQWLLDLADALERVALTQHSEEPYLRMRERRDGLRRRLPQLAAEQGVLHLSGEDPLNLAQDLLLQAGTVLSCARDLHPILAAAGPGSAAATFPWAPLISCGAAHLRASACGSDGRRSRRDLQALRQRLQRQLEDQPPSGEGELLLCSRLLMLSDALLSLRRLPAGARPALAGPVRAP
ncbi:FUSC family protein [Synechococcus sp. CBW1006]|uniref:FUSC family protein n=1 Tax=Synechococcus sp. CBW1006 TaxID=1353138 RepID=UPI0018CDD594|nr:FUSC family protein [Synechococcus sp. CBW1006]QPN67484.1 FUSC family protein [Synechococcus sp. CBW1006]